MLIRLLHKRRQLNAGHTTGQGQSVICAAAFGWRRVERLDPLWGLSNEQGDDYLLEQPRDHGGYSRGRPRYRGFYRARTTAWDRRKYLQRSGFESFTRHAVSVR